MVKTFEELETLMPKLLQESVCGKHLSTLAKIESCRLNEYQIEITTTLDEINESINDTMSLIKTMRDDFTRIQHIFEDWEKSL